MPEETKKSPLPAWRFNAELERFQGKIDTAQKTIDNINQMSELELARAAQNAYYSKKEHYRLTITALEQSGESYEGEIEEYKRGSENLKRLAPDEWKYRTLRTAQSKKDFYAKEQQTVQTQYTPV